MVALTGIVEKVNVFNNRSLFSNHYIETYVPKTPEWKEDERAQIAFNEISKVYQQNQRAMAAYKEAQLEDNFIRPVLKVLGHFFGIQGKVADNARVPDYAFFPSQDSLDEAYQLQGTQDFYLNAIAVGDAKAWDISLDKSQTSGKGMWDKQNPSYQIDTYLRDTPPVWGLLTNGRQWRLYHESTSNKLDVYYEVDLESLLKSGDLEAFKYFYLFFRFEAFPKFPGDSFLDRTREGSQAYTKEIGEELEENVYKAMQKLAEGFFADPTNGLNRSEEDLKLVQDNSMRLLYRILFISFAESRRLLDTSNRYYHGMSLQETKKEIATKIDAGDFLAPFSYAYWEKLNNLFDLINEGSESDRWRIDRKVFYIPAYNGGLFDPVQNTFLTTKHVSDPYLAEALDFLARSDKAMVDYSSLDIKHLGSIYEGLLEYKLAPDLSLLTDKGERRATGSFYTPDPEVKHIVESTLGPVLAQKKKEWAQLLDRRKFADYILSIKVLDLAMGSGHFLVEAVDYLARALVEAWATARKEDAQTKEIAEHDIQWARREVIRKCIYGVDLNPMAVELAKLALWLTTAAANKPLSFLDHHLRCGNSLVGVSLDSLVTLPTSGEGQGSLPAFFIDQRKKLIDDLLRKYDKIDSTPDDSLKAVKDKEKQFKALMVDESSQRIREVANVKLSTYFGNTVKDDDYEWMCNGINPELSPGWSGVRDLEWFKKAQQIAQEQRFFHWELEFPEAFMQGGFDVIIGNPPYVRQEGLGEIKDYLETHFKVYQGTADLYTYFIERGLQLLRNYGLISYIVSNKWMRADYGKPLRQLLKEQCVEEIIDFCKLLVFKGVMVHTCILKASKRLPAAYFLVTKVQVPQNALDSISLSRYAKENTYSVSYTGLQDDGWSLADNRAQDLLDKLQNKGKPLKDYLRKSVYRGLVTGLGDAFVIDEENKEKLIAEDPKSNEVIKPFIGGRGIFRYQPPKNDKYIIAMPKGWTNSQRDGTLDAFSWLQKSHPAIARHLVPFAEMAEKRYDQGDYWWELRACDYYAEFEKPKIMYQKFQGEPTFTFDVSGMYANSAIWIIPSADKLLLGILNSKLGWFFISNYCTKIQIGYQLIFKYLGKIPLPIVDSDPQSKALQDEISSLVEQILNLNKQKQSEVQGFLKWLEGEIGAKIMDLTGTSKLHEYYNLDFSGFHALLAKNKRKLKEGYDPKRRGPEEILEAEFNDSVAKIKVLTAKEEETDRQIDALVYKLYGLTEEEIKIVEGKRL